LGKIWKNLPGVAQKYVFLYLLLLLKVEKGNVNRLHGVTVVSQYVLQTTNIRE